ncbi:DUF1853 family protein [Gulbenkiania mobilis]|uniref:DUF1853 family protein n=1 Tax=Gulbenkiania mobilis TaxID=397457 RepID=UPI0006BBE3DA|nr:DUF1853 family protein [Gulbenkiania mobilis]
MNGRVPPVLDTLHQPVVRDLAFLLYAPPPWPQGGALPPGLLAGQDAERLLQALDRAPQPLLRAVLSPGERRLGRYAERLLAFWLAHAPHLQPVSANLAVRDANGRTLGEFDFLLRINGEPWHLEVASKFYLALGAAPASLVGPSLRDAWALKAGKLTQQLQLTRHPEAQRILPPGFAGCLSGSLLTGWLFAPPKASFERPFPQALYGWWCAVNQPWPQSCPGSRWAWLPRLGWLAPARLHLSATDTQPRLARRLFGAGSPQMVAEMQATADGAWREVARGFVTPPGWPGHSPFNALLQVLSAVPGVMR